MNESVKVNDAEVKDESLIFSETTHTLQIDPFSKKKFKKPYWLIDLSYNLKKTFVYPLQRLFRGYADNDLWNLDYFYGNMIVKSMKAFKEKTCSYPPELTFEKWQEVLDDIIFAFEHETVDWYDLEMKEKNLSKEEKENIKDRVSRGFDYFKKYYKDLWW